MLVYSNLLNHWNSLVFCTLPKWLKSSLKERGQIVFDEIQRIEEGNSFSFIVEKNDPKAGLPTIYQPVKDKIEILTPVQIMLDGTSGRKRLAFTDKVKVEMKADPGTKIYYTLDGSTPSRESNKYKSAFFVNESSTVKAISIKKEVSAYTVTEARLNQVRKVASIQLEAEPSPKYHAEGALSLIDGDWGGQEFTNGKWLGFADDDLVATIKLNEKKKISSVTVSTLKNENSWIFAPSQIIISASDDGENYEIVGRMSAGQINDLLNLGKDCRVMVKSGKYQYVKVQVQNSGPHKGYATSWLFVDEIAIK